MKIDQKCLSLCAEVDCFLSLEVLKKGYATPTDFWKELDSGPDTVSRWGKSAVSTIPYLHSTVHDISVLLDEFLPSVDALSSTQLGHCKDLSHQC